MLSARGWARLSMGALTATVLAVAACEEDDAVFGPLEDLTPPTVSITDAQSTTAGGLDVTVRAEDFISVSQVVTEIRLTNQLVTEITPEGDTLVLGRLIGVDTTKFSGRSTSVTVNASFLTLGLTQSTLLTIRAIAVDAQDNRAIDQANIIAGGGTGGQVGAPQVQITSPAPNQTVRNNTVIRVGVLATDEVGISQLNVVLSGAHSATDNTSFTDFRTTVDTLLDFFIPSGVLGPLTISAEAINRNNISGFAEITVTVDNVVADDTIPPSVSMLVSGGTQVRLDEPKRMEADDSLRVDVVAQDQETAITRVGVTMTVTNLRPGGPVSETITEDSVFAVPISGTVPVFFGLVPEDPRLASVFTADDIPDTLTIDITAWAFDDAATPNCGATVDTSGVASRLDCTSTTPIQAVGAAPGRVLRLIVAGRTIGFPQGSLIADAAVDTLRELLLLSDIEFGVVRVFDLRNEVFVDDVPVGSAPWGLSIDNTEDQLLVGNSGGTNISVVGLGPRTPGAPAVVGEVDRFQTQDLKVFRVEEEEKNETLVFVTTFFDYSDRPQFIAQASTDLILFSTRPALANIQPGTIREFDPNQREIRFFIAYADRASPSNPEIQIVNADSVFSIDGGARFVICDHTRGVAAPAGRSCITADSLAGARLGVDTMNGPGNAGWDVDVFTDLVIESIGLQDTTFVAPSGDREFIAFGEGDTPDRAGRVIMYESATGGITNALQVTDLTGNAADRIFGLALNNDGGLGVGRGQVAFYFGGDVLGGPNVLRLLGTNDDVNPTGTGAALHPDHFTVASFDDPDTRLSFLGSGDSKVEIVDTRFFDFKRGEVLIRDPIAGPLRATRRLPPDPANVAVKLYGVTPNGVVVIEVRDTDIEPL